MSEIQFKEWCNGYWTEERLKGELSDPLIQSFVKAQRLAFEAGQKTIEPDMQRLISLVKNEVVTMHTMGCSYVATGKNCDCGLHEMLDLVKQLSTDN